MEARRFRVARKVRESEVISSFYLEAADGRPLEPFKGGQFLTFEIDLPGQDEAVVREYSLSSPPHDTARYRVAVKREDAPPGRSDLPSGLVSNYLHDHVEEGVELSAHDPRGQFVLDADSTQPVVLLSGGVGLTPTVSMLHELAAAGDRDAWFIHACDNGRVHAMGDEVRALAAGNPRIRTHFCYRFPESGDAGRFDSEGVVTKELLQSLLPLDDYEFYLCGPSPFMKAIYGALRDLGVHNDRVHFEFFGPATLITEPEEPAKVAPVTESSDAAAAGPQVTFRKSGKTVVWDGSAETLLEFAESHGLQPEFSCRAGVCNTCMIGLAAGEVHYIEEPLDPPEPGTALICCSRPITDVELDI